MPVKTHYFPLVFFLVYGSSELSSVQRTEIKVGFGEQQLGWEELIRLETMAFVSLWTEQPTAVSRPPSNQKKVQSGVESGAQSNRLMRFFEFPLELLLNQNPERLWSEFIFLNAGGIKSQLLIHLSKRCALCSTNKAIFNLTELYLLSQFFLNKFVETGSGKCHKVPAPEFCEQVFPPLICVDSTHTSMTPRTRVASFVGRCSQRSKCWGDSGSRSHALLSFIDLTQAQSCK